MRVSRAQAEANRETVINVASRLFREHGFDGIGLKVLMKGAGLTQGGFYKQFESKDDLAARASRRAMESATRRWSDAAAGNVAQLEAILNLYLSLDHRDEIGDGCPLVALGADVARQSPDVKAPFEDGIRGHLAVLDELLTSTPAQERSDRAMALLSIMVGAVTLSRVVNDKDLSKRFLDAAAAEARRMSGLAGAPSESME